MGSRARTYSASGFFFAAGRGTQPRAAALENSFSAPQCLQVPTLVGRTVNDASQSLGALGLALRIDPKFTMAYTNRCWVRAAGGPAEIEKALEQPMGCNDSDRLGRARRVDDAQGPLRPLLPASA